MKLMKYTCCLMIFMFLSFHGFSQNSELKDWDTDNDKLITITEYRVYFDEHDYYDRWDENNDEWIDEDEWKKSMSESYGDNYNEEKHGSFSDWDANEDGYVDEDEYTENSFLIWDDNIDETIDNDEYQIWNNTGIY